MKLVAYATLQVIKTGWIMSFFFFLKENFLVNAVAYHPLLLLVDGDSTHCDLMSLKFAADKGIIIFCLPPHTTLSVSHLIVAYLSH